jgi:hypothetical protein
MGLSAVRSFYSSKGMPLALFAGSVLVDEKVLATIAEKR